MYHKVKLTAPTSDHHSLESVLEKTLVNPLSPHNLVIMGHSNVGLKITAKNLNGMEIGYEAEPPPEKGAFTRRLTARRSGKGSEKSIFGTVGEHLLDLKESCPSLMIVHAIKQPTTAA